jgi:hypothetical protein
MCVVKVSASSNSTVLIKQSLVLELHCTGGRVPKPKVTYTFGGDQVACTESEVSSTFVKNTKLSMNHLIQDVDCSLVHLR